MAINSRRMIIIGMDGMPYRLIRDLSQNGVMPNTRTIIEKGIFRQMESSIPEISSVAWSSIVTGTNPGSHGIFGFNDIPLGTYRLSFPNFNDLRMPPFWKQGDNGTSVIINVPFTYPAAKLDGALIAGFVALNLQRATYPPSLVPCLNDMGYQIDVDSSKARKSLDLFLTDLDRTLQARIAAYQYLWEKEDWQTFMLVFTGTDRLAHFFWDAYEDKSHKYHQAFLDHLHHIDEVIGEIVHRMKDNDTLVILSDHGFELLEYDVNINFFLSQNGFLKFKQNPAQSLADIDYGTKAFALEPGRIYVNLEGKYPRGSVKPEERDLIISELEKSFESINRNGRNVIGQMCRKEEIYAGPCLEQAPDLVLLPGKGFNFRAGLKARNFIVNKSTFTGKHTQKDAFLLVSDSSEGVVPEKPSVSDVVGIMDRLKERQVNRQ